MRCQGIQNSYYTFFHFEKKNTSLITFDFLVKRKTVHLLHLISLWEVKQNSYYFCFHWQKKIVHLLQFAFIVGKKETFLLQLLLLWEEKQNSCYICFHCQNKKKTSYYIGFMLWDTKIYKTVYYICFHCAKKKFLLHLLLLWDRYVLQRYEQQVSQANKYITLLSHTGNISATHNVSKSQKYIFELWDISPRVASYNLSCKVF